MKMQTLSKRAVGAAVIASMLMAPAAGFAATRFEGSRGGYNLPMHTAAPAMRAYASTGPLATRWHNNTDRACMQSLASLTFEPCFGR